MSVRSLRRLATASAALVLAVLLPSAPAFAALPSGNGLSGSWRYYDPKAFELRSTLRGAALQAYVADNGGQRTPVATVSDTEKDGLCVRASFYSDPGGFLGMAQLCDGWKPVNFYPTPGYGRLFAYLHKMKYVDGVPRPVDHVLVVVPDSREDPGLRSVGTGASWAYTSSTGFHYDLSRPGVRVWGDGFHHPGDDDRTAISVAQNLAGKDCVKSLMSDPNESAFEMVCAPDKEKTHHYDDFDAVITIRACYLPSPAQYQCVETDIPEPVKV